MDDTKKQNIDQSEPQDQTQPEDPKACEQCSQWEDKYLHMAADFQNYKRRSEKDRSNWVGAAQEEMLVRVLKIIDDFDRALSQHQSQEHSEQLDAWLQGFELIGKTMHKMLDEYDVKKITEYKTFDPNFHEAVAQVESEGHQEGAIVDVYEPGYLIGEKVLRPAKVTVAK